MPQLEMFKSIGGLTLGLEPAIKSRAPRQKPPIFVQSFQIQFPPTPSFKDLEHGAVKEGVHTC